MRYAFNFPLFDYLSDERVLADLAVDLEQAGWDAAFVWDHVNLHMKPVVRGGPHAEPWIALALMADRTERILLGTSVTPLARRRPVKVAREALAIHRLSGGRFIFGAGIGDTAPEFGDLGDASDLRVRAAMLDESLSILQRLWRGEVVQHEGEHYRVSTHTPMETADIPIWLAGTWPNRQPYRRAARYDGVFAAKVGFVEPLAPEAVAELVAYVNEHRNSDQPFAFAITASGSADFEADRANARALAEAGANWWVDGAIPRFEPLEALRERIRRGPPR